MIRTIFELFFLYLLYKLIFDFVIPVYQTTKQVKKKVNEMQRNINEQVNNQKQQQTPFTSATKETTAKAIKEDYIDFEEIK